MSQQDPQGVLLIYTGGTIGMVPDSGGMEAPLRPASLTDLLSRMPDFDPETASIRIGARSVRLGTYSWNRPKDSSDMEFRDWVELADAIADNYDEYEGFVILHGTDTLAYTASALAFMLDGLSKPVVLTGSQRPIRAHRSDAPLNVVAAIEFAAAHSLDKEVIPEVVVFFGDRLYRGCRTTKINSSSYSCFDSPDCPPLALVGERVQVDRGNVLTPTPGGLSVARKLEAGIASLTIFPGVSAELIGRMLETEGLRGVVLRAFGTGNVPSDSQFLGAIRKAVDSGVVVVVVTQCGAGGVHLGKYESSELLLGTGAVSGHDMTAEAALTKLAVVLGEHGDPTRAADLMELNLRGEQSVSVERVRFPAGSAGADPVFVEPSREAPRPFGGISGVGDIGGIGGIREVRLRTRGLGSGSTDDAEAAAIDFTVYLRRVTDGAAGPRMPFSLRVRPTESRGASVSSVVSEGLGDLPSIDELVLEIVPHGGPITWTGMDLALLST